MLDRFVGLWLGEELLYDIERFTLAMLSFFLTEYLIARRNLAVTPSKVPLGSDPAVVEGDVRHDIIASSVLNP
ncbi:hypothetical protein [Haladaptatus halobius]|uniref:hypothetical protein n=1 Tax=Haladaptatus halobius TaxID=2884875 RepID=UPI001D0B45B5|nr:hypothetical protein [Haladaptatus halobius]